jgi:ribosomal protein L19E
MRIKEANLPPDVKQFIDDNHLTMNDSKLAGATGFSTYKIKNYKKETGLKHPRGSQKGKKRSHPRIYPSTRCIKRSPIEDRHGNFNVFAFENWLI